MLIAIVGGKGTGKTMLNVKMALDDLKEGKRIFTNIKFTDYLAPRYHRKITYLTPQFIEDMLEKLHKKEINFEDSAIHIQEFHNFADSRRFASRSNILISYFNAQSRHAGNGKYFNFVLDTQHLGMIDIRIRRSVDCLFKPLITEKDKDGIPTMIKAETLIFNQHKFIEAESVFDVKDVYKYYDSYEIVSFSYDIFKKRS